jgi:hypothetical protein
LTTNKNIPALGWERTTNGKNDRPIDVARSKGHTNPALLALLEPPNLLPQWSQEDVQAVEKNFHDTIRSILNGIAEEERLRLPNLEIFRELGEDVKVSMQVPGMYGVSLCMPNWPIGDPELWLGFLLLGQRRLLGLGVLL